MAGSGEEACGIPFTLTEIELGNVFEMAKDKLQSRHLQRLVSRGDPEAVELVYRKVEPHFKELVLDQYGNHLAQRLLEAVKLEPFTVLFKHLEGTLPSLALDNNATRVVQKIVEQATQRKMVPQLIKALPFEHAPGFTTSVTGFHVAVKLLELLPDSEVQSLIPVLCSSPEKVLQIAFDQWGCCVLKKCLDRADASLPSIADVIVENALKLVQDPYGNYVVQHLIVMGPDGLKPHLTRVIDALKGRMFELSLQKFSSNVLEKCLQWAPEVDRVKIINEILSPSSCSPTEAIRQLLFHRFGNYVFQQALDVAQEPQFALLVELAKPHVQEAIKSYMASQSEGVDESPAEEPSAEHSDSGTTLRSDHVKRLAFKLAKKHACLMEGLDLQDPSFAADSGIWWCDPSAYDWAGDSWLGHPSALGFSMPFDPSGGFGGIQPFLYSGTEEKGQKRWSRQARAQRKSSRGKQQGTGRRTARSPGREHWEPVEKQVRAQEAKAAAPKAAAAEPPKVRTVGYWPNYFQVEVDQVPAEFALGAPAAAPHKRSRRSRKGNSNLKASQKEEGGLEEEKECPTSFS